MRNTTLTLRSVDEHAVPPGACRAGAATYGQRSRHPELHDSLV